MFVGLFQFTVIDEALLAQPSSPIDDAMLVNMTIIGSVLLLIVGVVFIVRSFTRSIFKIKHAFDLTVLSIMVPKEKKSEGSSNASQEERLEQVREEIGITETIFATVAGLRAQRGIHKWFKGRNDHFSFEMVVHNNLINFYVAVPHKLKGFLEQQINAQYPYAHIETMVDYNILWGPIL